MTNPEFEVELSTTVEREQNEFQFNLDPTTWVITAVRGSDPIHLSVWNDTHTHKLSLTMSWEQYNRLLSDLRAAQAAFHEES